ncbi:5240_t:CDS:2 [Rhizophagus irregularis]|nr:5240_t:CDS:2 [Rhizophagus irregularis]
MSSQGTQISNASFDIAKLIDTIDFAAKKHSFQKRKDSAGTLYDLVTIQAAILHDTVEDTKTTFEEIEQKFGREVKNIVAECTDDKSLEKEERQRLQIEHTPHISKQAKEVKLADKLYNLRDIMKDAPIGWSKKRVQGARGINQKLEEQLDDIYANGVFVLQGEEYKCHP